MLRIMHGMFVISVEDAESLVAFIKMHEREEIPENVFDICMKLQSYIEESYI